MRTPRPDFYLKEVKSDEYNDPDHYHRSVAAALWWRWMGIQQTGEVIVVSQPGWFPLGGLTKAGKD
jgi:hypothetical protein